ncbi:hypothetical protein LTR84_000166 [Exophiala bonariae]|uniref:Rieske domain-containing protein n=1 Tax=Exophiala bonariae TaxID=1690606 RepID=A0AAV9NQ75_9EURO|nr:hypothetical protein LTR84_000166 [Exophiala bonariae]
MSRQAQTWGAIAVLTVVGIVWIKRQQQTAIYEPLGRSSLREMLTRVEDEEGTDGMVTKESEYPSNWWTSSELLDLERRAIFSKVPIALAHASMFSKPGAYRVFDHPSGYPIFLVLGKDSVLRGFHNVCRHRAYPVVSTKRSGCTPVLSCKYHGWSYDLRGNLVKAPKFDGLEGFTKAENSLFEVSVGVDGDGVVFVNVGALPGPSTAVVVARFSKYRVESWDVDVGFNWKFAEFSDTFDLAQTVEKYTPNCPSAALLSLLSLQKRTENIKPTVLTEILHFKGLRSTLMIKVRPVDGGKSILECAFYSTSANLDSSSLLDDIKQQLMNRITFLETAFEKTKHAVPQSNESHLSTILGWVKSHRNREASVGRPIWPASDIMATVRANDSAAENLCRDLEASQPDVGIDIEKHSASEISW